MEVVGFVDLIVTERFLDGSLGLGSRGGARYCLGLVTGEQRREQGALCKRLNWVRTVPIWVAIPEERRDLRLQVMSAHRSGALQRVICREAWPMPVLESLCLVGEDALPEQLLQAV